MATKNDLALAVLEDLGVVAAGESINASDAQLVLRRYDRLHEKLVTDAVAYWPAPVSVASNVIPARVMEPLTKVLAARCSKAFGLPRDYVEETEAMKELYKLAANEGSEKPTEALYF